MFLKKYYLNKLTAFVLILLLPLLASGCTMSNESFVQGEEGSKTKKEVKKVMGSAIILGDTDYLAVPLEMAGAEKGLGSIKSGEYYDERVVNYLFINKTENKKHLLFEKDVWIVSTNVEGYDYDDGETAETKEEPDLGMLVYEVVPQDTNADEKLDGDDYSYIYISDKNGDNIKVISPKERFIDYYKIDKIEHKLIIGMHDKLEKQYIQIYDYKVDTFIQYTLR